LFAGREVVSPVVWLPLEALGLPLGDFYVWSIGISFSPDTTVMPA
jgi:hypothetical protein